MSDYRTATELAALVGARKLSAATVVESHLRRIAARNLSLNAIVTLNAEGAIARARELDAQLAAGERPGPLCGVPVTVKDCYEVAGMRTTAGHPALSAYTPQRTATVVSRLQDAGAILLGKTNQATLGFGTHTANELFGATRNPLSDLHSPGGSSGGSAAAVAAGLSWLDVGSDTTGSARIPAAFCGTYGFKPSLGRIPLTGHIPPLPGMIRIDRWLTTPGVLASSAVDLSRAAGVLFGPDANEPDADTHPFDLAAGRPLTSLRVAWCEHFPEVPTDNSIRRAVRSFAERLQAAGARVEEALPDVSFDSQQALLLKLISSFGSLIANAATSDAAPLSASELFKLLAERDIIAAAWARFFSRYDLFLSPVSSCVAFPVELAERGLTVNGKEVEHWWVDRHCFPHNISGCPAVSIPVHNPDGPLPFAVQLISGRGKDELLLKTLEMLEAG